MNSQQALELMNLLHPSLQEKIAHFYDDTYDKRDRKITQEVIDIINDRIQQDKIKPLLRKCNYIAVNNLRSNVSHFYYYYYCKRADKYIIIYVRYDDRKMCKVTSRVENFYTSPYKLAKSLIKLVDLQYSLINIYNIDDYNESVKEKRIEKTWFHFHEGIFRAPEDFRDHIYKNIYNNIYYKN